MGNKLNHKIANRYVEIHTEYPEKLAGLLPGFVHFHDSADDNDPLIHLSEEFESADTELISADIENKVIHTFNLEEDSCKLSNLYSVAFICPAFNNFSQKNDIIALFFYSNAVIIHTR